MVHVVDIFTIGDGCMRKLTCLILIILITNFTLSSCRKAQQNPPQNFAFEFRYGVYGKNDLNTFEHKYTKDMVSDASITIPFKLTNDQMKVIYKKMMQIDVFDYPENFKPSDGFFYHTMVTPHKTYYFKVRAGNKTKVINWDDINLSKKKSARNLRDLTELIQKMIHESPEYKKLPEPKSGYL